MLLKTVQPHETLQSAEEKGNVIIFPSEAARAVDAAIRSTGAEKAAFELTVGENRGTLFGGPVMNTLLLRVLHVASLF